MKGEPRAAGAEREEAAGEPPLVSKTVGYRLVRGLVLAWFRLVHRARFEGREHLPRGGGALVVANHQSFLDIPLMAASTRRHCAFLARDTLLSSRLVRWLTRTSGSIPVRRGAADRRALREIVAHLRAGDLVVVFAEGTRTEDGSVGPFLGGFLFAARRAGVPVVPAGIRGTFEILPRERVLPRPRRCAVRYVAAVDPDLPDALERIRAAVVAAVGDGTFASVPPVDR